MKNVVRLGLTVAKVFTICLGLMLLGSVTASAALLSVPIKLEWDPSPSPDVAGYALYYGEIDGPTTNRVDLGDSAKATLTNLYADVTYQFCVVAYTADGLESAPSNLVEYTPPAISQLKLIKQANGSMRVQFRSAIGSPCKVEYTSSLASPQWQTLSNATANASGDVIVTDPLAGRPSVRFYRGTRQ